MHMTEISTEWWLNILISELDGMEKVQVHVLWLAFLINLTRCS